MTADEALKAVANAVADLRAGVAGHRLDPKTNGIRAMNAEDTTSKDHPMPLDEDALEAAFWCFDAERKRNGMERDTFKGQMRAFARAEIRRALRSF